MAGLNRELQASSLLECIVAAVILLASFMIATETLTRVTLAGDDPAENVVGSTGTGFIFRENTRESMIGGR